MPLPERPQWFQDELSKLNQEGQDFSKIARISALEALDDSEESMKLSFLLAHDEFKKKYPDSKVDMGTVLDVYKRQFAHSRPLSKYYKLASKYRIGDRVDDETFQEYSRMSPDEKATVDAFIAELTPRKTEKRGFVGNLAKAITEGATAAGGTAGTALNLLTGGDEQRRERGVVQSRFEGIQQASDPAEGEGFVSNAFIQAGRMLPDVAATVAVSAVTGGAGSIGYWTLRMQPEIYNDMRNAGVPNKYAQASSFVGGAAMAALETLQISKLVPKSVKGKAAKALSRSVTKSIASTVKDYVKNVGEQAIIEGGQGFIEALTKNVTAELANKLSKTDAETDWGQLLERPIQDAVQAIGPMAVLSLPGHVAAPVMVAKDAAEYKSRIKQDFKDYFLTSQGAKDFIQNFPEKADMLVRELDEKGKVSRTKAGKIMETGRVFSGKEATLFANMVKSEAVTQVATETPVESTAIVEPTQRPLDYKTDKRGNVVDVTEAPEKGFIRLYRGGHKDQSKQEDIFESFGEKNDQQTGGWFTTNLQMADYYRSSYGKDGGIFYIDIPVEQAKQYELKNFPELLQGRVSEATETYFIPELRTEPTQPSQIEEQVAEPPVEAPLAEQETQARPAITRIKKRFVQDAFKGADIQETDTGYKVNLPNGESLDIEQVDEIEIDWDLAERQEGRKIPLIERKNADVAGKVIIRTERGDKSGIAIMQLANKVADDSTVRHEALHIARKSGYLTQKEWDILVRKYSNKNNPVEKQEEDIATAAEAWRTGLIAKVKAAINKLLTKLGISNLKPETVETLMQSPEIWQRPTQAQQGEAYQLNYEVQKRLEDLKRKRGLKYGGPAYRTRRRSNEVPKGAKTFLVKDLVSDQYIKWSYKQTPTRERVLADANKKMKDYTVDEVVVIERGGAEKPLWHKEYGFNYTRKRPLTKKEEIEQAPRNYLARLEAERGAYDIVSNLENEAEIDSALEEREDDFYGEAYQIKYGRPELANVGTTPQARDLLDQVDENRKAEGKPKRTPITQDQAEARQRIEADREGERARIIEKSKKREGAVNPAEVHIAQQLYTEEATPAIINGDVEGTYEAMLLADAVRDVRSVWGKIGRAMRDPIETPAQRNKRLVTEALLEPDDSTAKKIKEAKKKGDKQAVNELLEEWSKQIIAIREALKDAGLDIAEIDKIAADPIQSARAVGVIQTHKASKLDALYEYWRNAILSGPKTQVVNISGNALHAAWHFTAERFVQALVNSALRKPEGMQWAELKHIWQGFLPGLSRGWRNMIKAWKSEMPVLEEELRRESRVHIEDINVAIKGKLGRIIRAPQRALGAADEFFKTAIATMEVGAQAYRMAKAEGLEGAELTQRINQLTLNTNSAAWSRAMDKAVELTFQEKLGPWGQKVLELRKQTPVMRYILPFITTPWNIFRIGVRKSPLGAINIINSVAKGKPLSSMGKEISEQIIAFGIAIAILGTNDPEDPWITGAEGETGYGRRQMSQREGTPPSQSVKIPFTDAWIGYGRIEPLATALSFIVDTTTALRSKDTNKIMKSPIKNILGQMKTKTFITSIGELIKLGESRDWSVQGGKMLSKFATSWNPNLLRQAVFNSVVEEFPERSVWGEGADFRERLLRRTAQKTAPGIIKEYPAIDIWGRTSTKSFKGPGGWIWNAIMPTDIDSSNIYIGDKIIMGWNYKNPDKEKYPQTPDKDYKYRKETYHMTDEQYYEFSKLAGKLTTTILNRVKFKDIDNPTERDLDIVLKAITNGRRIAKKRLLPKWHKK